MRPTGRLGVLRGSLVFLGVARRARCGEFVRSVRRACGRRGEVVESTCGPGLLFTAMAEFVLVSHIGLESLAG